MADPNPSAQGHLAHGSYGLEVVFANDDVWIWRCSVCHFLEAECSHRVCTWYDGNGDPVTDEAILSGVNLRCDFCDIDGT